MVSDSDVKDPGPNLHRGRQILWLLENALHAWDDKDVHVSGSDMTDLPQSIQLNVGTFGRPWAARGMINWRKGEEQKRDVITALLGNVGLPFP